MMEKTRRKPWPVFMYSSLQSISTCVVTSLLMRFVPHCRCLKLDASRVDIQENLLNCSVPAVSNLVFHEPVSTLASELLTSPTCIGGPFTVSLCTPILLGKTKNSHRPQSVCGTNLRSSDHNSQSTDSVQIALFSSVTIPRPRGGRRLTCQATFAYATCTRRKRSSACYTP